jgi:prepilin-type N-terminal cleavage/methylation domain-containing protein
VLARLRKSIDDKDQGFTLIELLVVIIIIGILAAIAIPVFLNQRKKGYDSAAKADLRNAASFQESYLTDNTSYFGPAANTVLTNANLPGFKPTANVTTTVISINGAQRYCMKAAHASSTNVYYWDSDAGGLSTTPCT